MKQLTVTSLILVFLCDLLTTAKAQTHSFVQLTVPTAMQESQLIWRNLHDIQFFEQHNYQVAYPSHPFIETLKQKARNQTLQEADYLKLIQVMKADVFDTNDYQLGAVKVTNQIENLNDMVFKLKQYPFNWAFKMFPTYEVTLTLYGPGGSFNPDTGVISLQTTLQGNFKNYPDPINTIIHEIVHIGVEASLVQALGLTHPQKERLVDNIVVSLFSEQLPNYRIQSLGDDNLDVLFKNPSSIRSLKEELSKLLASQSSAH